MYDCDNYSDYTVLSDDPSEGMCQICGQDYADNPSLLCEECRQLMYDSVIAMMDWLIDTDKLSDYLHWYYTDTDASYSELRKRYEYEPIADTVETLTDYAKDHYREYENYCIDYNRGKYEL